MFVLFVVTPAALYGLYKSQEIWHSPYVWYSAGLTTLVISYLVELRTETTPQRLLLNHWRPLYPCGVFIQGVRRMAIEDYKS